jgi:hypothetical protein
MMTSNAYYDAGNQYCLCHLSEEQIKLFLSCLQKLTQRTWQQLIEGSSKNPANGTGLNATLYHRSALSNPDFWPGILGPDVESVVGVRASDRSRVFGVRIGQVYYVLWFDEGHSVVRT